MKLKNDHEENFELPLVPMIDMMLVLLIFFMVATTLKVMQPEIPVQLPDSAASISVKEEPNILVIGLDNSGQKYINGVLTTTEELHARLKDAAAKDVTQPVRLDIDRGTSFDRVVEVLDLCQFEGLKNIGFPYPPTRSQLMHPSEKIAKLSTREWLISLAGHAIILGLLIYLIPARDIARVFTKGPREGTRSPRKRTRIRRKCRKWSGTSRGNRPRRPASM